MKATIYFITYTYTKDKTMTAKKFDSQEQKYWQRTYIQELKSANEALDNVIATLERAVEDVKRHKGYLSEHIGSKKNSSVVDPPNPVSVIGWVVNNLCANLLGNCRLDTLVGIAADIAKAKTELDKDK